MRFGRKKRDTDSDEPVEAVDDATGAGDGADGADAAPAGPVGPPERGRARPEAGPYDASEVDLDEGDWIDLGSLLLPNPAPLPVELRLQADNTTGQVTSVLLVGQSGAVELRPFAASRGGGAWEELRPRIAAETAKHGGTSTEQEGAFGTELLCLVPVKNSEGQPATQVSRFAGHEGPTWLLRTNLLGQPAVEPGQGGGFEDLIRSVVVRRGAGAMAPGSALPLQLPPEAREIRPGEGAAGADPEPVAEPVAEPDSDAGTDAGSDAGTDAGSDAGSDGDVHGDRQT